MWIYQELSWHIVLPSILSLMANWSYSIAIWKCISGATHRIIPRIGCSSCLGLPLAITPRGIRPLARPHTKLFLAAIPLLLCPMNHKLWTLPCYKNSYNIVICF
ncbi:hypothetical protein AAHE18_03G165400 [Arachis hypogaea]